MDAKIWFSPRALRLHAVILVVVPGFMALCLWQVSRALAGNELSWAYVFEWPLFAAYAVYMWWRLVHELAKEGAPSPTAGGPPGGTDEAVPAGGPTGDAPPGGATAGAALPEGTAEDAELAAYNAYLAQLAERDRAAGH